MSTRFTAPVLPALLLLLSGVRAQQPVDPSPLPPALEKQLAKALPAGSQVRPRRPRRVLICSATRGGSVHRVIAFGNRALSLMGPGSGAYTALVSNDPANFLPQRIKQFDAVIFHNTSGRVLHLPMAVPPHLVPEPLRSLRPGGTPPGRQFTTTTLLKAIARDRTCLTSLRAGADRQPTARQEATLRRYLPDRKPGPVTPADQARIRQCLPRLQAWAEKVRAFDAADPQEERLLQSLLAYVKGGGGFVGIHGAAATYKQEPRYLAMIGAAFDGHPWGPKCTVAVANSLPDNPLNAAFGRRGFTIRDEIYQFKAPWNRKLVTVLLALDLVDGKERLTGIAGRRRDRDYPISWYRDYGKGRVFYCSLGHNREVFLNRRVLAHFLAGIQYACGDLSPGTKATKEEQ